MNSETPVMRGNPLTADPRLAGGDQSALARLQEKPANLPVKKITFARFAAQTFRGRYFVLIVLGLIVGAGTGYLGWRMARPVYRSEGLVRIADSLPVVMKETDQNQPIQAFDTFMGSQKTLIMSRRTTDQAVLDPIWAAMSRQPPAAPDKYFADNLVVDIKGRSEFIRIMVTDYDPIAAAAATTAVVNAYAYQYKERELRLKRERAGKLEDSQSELKSRIDELTKSLEATINDYGTTKLEIFYEAQRAKVGKMEYALNDLYGAIATAKPGKSSNQPEKKSENPKSKNLSVDAIARVDLATHNFKSEQERLEDELEKMTDPKQRGLGQEHPEVLRIKSQIESAKKRVEKSAASYREIYSELGSNNGADLLSTSITAGRSIEALQASATNIEAILKKNRDEMVRIGKTMRAADHAEEELKSLQAEYYKLVERQNSLKIEERSMGRLELLSTGDVPISPDRDPRIRMAAVTGVAGLALPWGLFLLTGMVWRKFRYSDEMETDPAAGNSPLLGILPELSETGTDRDEMLAAAHSIHQVRVSLQARSEPGTQTYLITSAAAGEGKTSLTLSLGLSFAVSKQRTLVIDADLVGRHLTAKLDMQGVDGLHEALETGRIESLLQRTDDGLFVLTAGKAAAQHAYAMPASAFRKLLTEARRHFDVILIDSGPILGSVEAAVLAQEVDGVIFAITRGQKQRNVSQAMSRLAALKVKIVGLIFNRAKPEDFRRSPYGSSYRSMSVPPAPQATKTRIEALSAFGPLVNAVDARKPE